MSLAANLYSHRKKNKLSIAEVAAHIGTTQGAISHYERGRRSPTISRLAKLAQLYHITIDDLIK